MATVIWPWWPFREGATNHVVDFELPRGVRTEELDVQLVRRLWRLGAGGEPGYVPTDEECSLFQTHVPAEVTGPRETDWRALWFWITIEQRVELNRLPDVWERVSVPLHHQLAANEVLAEDIAKSGLRKLAKKGVKIIRRLDEAETTIKSLLAILGNRSPVRLPRSSSKKPPKPRPGSTTEQIVALLKQGLGRQAIAERIRCGVNIVSTASRRYRHLLVKRKATSNHRKK